MGTDCRILQETGDVLLVESGGQLLANFPSTPFEFVQENGDNLLQENGDLLLMDQLLCPITFQPFFAFMVQGRIGKEAQADPWNVNGIWQARKIRGRKRPLKMRFYTPTNPRSVAQQANRQKFADAMVAWGNLTSEQKAGYNVRAKRRRMFGWGLFIREYYQQF